MNKIKDFLIGLIQLAFSGLTAFFAVVGAAEYVPEYIDLKGSTGEVLAIVYFFAVLMLVNIGISYYKEATNSVGKKK